MIWIGIIIGLNLGVILSCLWAHFKMPTEDDCRVCGKSYLDEIDSLRQEIATLKKSRAALGGMVNKMTWEKTA
jgi:hypothetical protein